MLLLLPLRERRSGNTRRVRTRRGRIECGLADNRRSDYGLENLIPRQHGAPLHRRSTITRKVSTSLDRASAYGHPFVTGKEGYSRDKSGTLHRKREGERKGKSGKKKGRERRRREKREGGEVGGGVGWGETVRQEMVTN